MRFGQPRERLVAGRSSRTANPSRSNSQHLRVLKEAGSVVERRQGTSRIYRADKDALGPLRSAVEDHWRRGLGRVKDLAEAEQREKDRS